MKRLIRIAFILWVVFRFGLDQLLLQHFQHPGIRLLTRLLGWRRRFTAPPGQRLRQALEKLGPIFVKFGQLLSTRRDLLPAELASELALLQDRVPAFPSDQAIAIIEKAFGKPIDQLFVDFQNQPIASASIAQVHFATLVTPDGTPREVAVKVLRPNILGAIEQDLDIMRLMARWLEQWLVDGRRLKPRAVVAEFDVYLHDELDLVREAANASQLRRNMEGLNLVLIPEMYWDLCRTDVLVMERMIGIPISQTDRLRQAGVDIPKLARDGVTIFFTQVFRDGFFHADMHPGNIQVSVAPDTFGQYVSLDFGIVGTLTQYDKEYLAQNFVAFFRRDYKRVAELHIESGWVPLHTRVDELESAIRTVCEPYFDRPLKEISLGTVLLRLFQTSRRFQVEILPQMVLLQKTLLNVEGLGRELDPDLDLWSTAKPFLEHWMAEQIGAKRLWQELRNQAPYYAKMLPQLPRLLHARLLEPDKIDRELLNTLLKEQQRANNLMRILLYLGLGFIASLLFHQIWFLFDPLTL